jgi:hypothetical protein
MSRVTILSTDDWSEVYVSDYGYYYFEFSQDGRYIALGTQFDIEKIIVVDLTDFSVKNEILKKMDFSNMRIKGLIAYYDHINYFIQRGAQGWYTKNELLALSKEKYSSLLKDIGLDENIGKVKGREAQVDRVIKLIYG